MEQEEKRRRELEAEIAALREEVVYLRGELEAVVEPEASEAE